MPTYRIFKYELDLTDIQTVPTARGRILCIENQNNRPMLYILATVDSIENNQEMFVEISTMGTGHRRQDIDPDSYMTTLMLNDGMLVLHYFVKVVNQA